MESSVRYVQLPNAGHKPALCFRGSKSAYAIINHGTIRTIEIDLKDYDKAQRVKSTKNGGEDYSPVAFAEAIARIAQRTAITARAQVLLEKGFALAPEDPLPSEEVMPVPKNEEDETVAQDSETTVADDETPKPKAKMVRKAARRINSEGKAEVPERQPLGVLPPGKRANGSAGTPRQADRPKPGPLLPTKSVRGAEGTKKEAKPAAKRGGAKTLVAALAAEAGLAQQPCRVKLRAAGLRAPYDEKNEAACRKALGLPTKGKK